MGRKVIAIEDTTLAEQRAVRAVGEILREQGMKALDMERVARRSKVSRSFLYRRFQDLSGLLRRYSQTEEFWPSVDELLGDDRGEFEAMTPARQIAHFFKKYLTAIRSRPATLELLAWEGVEKNELFRVLDMVRERTALEYFEHMKADPPEDVDLTAVILFLAGAVHFLAVRSRDRLSLGGIDLSSEAGWQRIEKTIDDLVLSALSEEAKKDC